MKINQFAILLTVLLFCGIGSMAQTFPVGGVVRSESGTLPGVSVIVKSSGAGTQTDAKGSFTIQAKTTDTLVFSFSGLRHCAGSLHCP